MIRSVRVVFLRAIVRQLEDHGVNLHQIAEEAAVSIVDLRRLTGFGSDLARDEGDRLIDLGTRLCARPMPKRSSTRVLADWRHGGQHVAHIV